MADPLDAPQIMRRWMKGAGVGALVCIPIVLGGIIAVARASSNHSQAWAILVLVIGSVLLATGALLFFIFRSQADQAAWLARHIATDALVRWSYSAEEKARFSTKLAQPGDATPRFMRWGVLVVVVVAVLLGGLPGYSGGGLIPAIEFGGLVGGFFGGCLALFWFQTKAEQRDRAGLLNGVVIGREGMLASNGYWAWSGTGSKLSSVTYRPGDPAFVLIDLYVGVAPEQLENSIVRGSRIFWAASDGAVPMVSQGESHFIIPIPVPSGREAEAQQLVATLSEQLRS
jgi:hypothetical protein